MKQKLFLLLAFCMCIGVAVAQTTVKGTVTQSTDGEPVIGATVLVQGTTTGAITDIDGNFVINNVPANAKQLQVSYIGMRTVVVAIAPTVNIVLEPESSVLDDVVVVAYGTAKRSSITGAISQVNKAELEKRPVSSVTSALEGTTSGVQVNSTYGQPGDEPSIRIRGIGTINGSASPLYVIDGVPFGGNISDLNSNDIESISVLKDAASCALYGNRASNGVILITTKKGTSERVSFDLKINQGSYTRGTKEYALTNARQFMEASWQNLKNATFSTGKYTEEQAREYASKNLISEQLKLNIFNKPADQLFDANGHLVADAQILPGYLGDLDWYDAAIRSGYRQEYNLSANAASERSNYYLSLGYLDEQGYVSNSGFNRLNGRAVINLTPKKWLKTGINLSASHQVTDWTNGSSGASYTNAFMYCRQIAPIYPIHTHNPKTGEYILDAAGNKSYDDGFYYLYDNDGNLIENGDTRNQYVDRHVIWENELNMDRTYRNTLQGTAYVDIMLPKNFTISIKGDLNLRNSEERTYNNARIGDGKGSLGRTSRTIYRYKNYTFQQQLNWNGHFGNHNVDALVAHENYNNTYDYTYLYKTGETFPSKPQLQNFTSMTSMDGYGAFYTTESYLGRVRYNYMDKYNFEGSFRRDGSSRFHPDSRWGNFFSVGANWLVTQEEFMKDITWVNNLKVLANYGQVGNDAGSGYYGYMALLDADQNGGQGAYYLVQNANPDLKWETGESWGIGFEARLFNRWNLNVEYFDKRNKDLLFKVQLPLSAGPTSSGGSATVTKNIGTISNKGVEINTDVDVFKNRDWKVNIATNASIIRNKVIKLPEQNKDGIIDGTKKYLEGRDLYDFYLYTWEGVDQMTGKSLYKPNFEDYYYMEDGKRIGGIKDGVENPNAAELTNTDDDVKISNINGNYYVYKTTYAAREYHGSALPKIYGSFSGSVTYKTLTVSALFTYSLGGKTYDGVYASMMGTGTGPSNYHSDIMNSWTEIPAGMTETSPNRVDPNGIPMINSTLSSDNNAGTTSRWLTKGDYLVLKNINIAYTLPKAWAKAIDLQNISVNASCENLFTLTARQGMNPQQSFTGTQGNYLVTPRVFTMGINIKF